ncbi:MAG: CRISPR-associated endoribonuclease Cas6 [Bacteroidetes bacterium]|nr:CRISPR-associated endoribonuclease Cas6 [Bacteroidota bacterium]
MRLRLVLRPHSSKSSITFNYPYYLSAAIYRWIEKSSPGYSQFLHEQGFSPEHVHRNFKHFCFSRLNIALRDTRTLPGRIVILSPTIDWLVSMPVEESLQHFVTGIFERREFFIEHEENRFIVEQVETLPEPAWKERMGFRMLSPTSVSVPEMRNGRMMPVYLFHDDARAGYLLRKNILNKYQSLHSTLPDDTRFDCTLDGSFIADREQKGDRVTQLVTIKEGQLSETKIRAFLCPLTIEGNPELIKLAYDSGLGEKNSLGFGMIEEMTRK